MKRRIALEKIVYAAGMLIAVPTALTSCEDDIPAPDDNNNTNNGTGDKLVIDISSAGYSALASAGGSVIVNNIIIANTGNNNFVALSSKCTHNGCTIFYSAANNHFPCPCHGAIFSTQGAVLNGPAQTALKSYPVSVDGNILTIG